MNRGTVLVATLLALVVLLACDLPGTATPRPTTPVEGLVGVWVEARRVGADGASSEPDDPLYLGFFSDGTFKAVHESRTFETYHDFWGDWAAQDGALTLAITGGNDLPQRSEYQGRFEVHEGELVLENVALVDDFAGPTLVFSYHGPEPEGKIIP